MKVRLPQALRPGDLIAVTAPSSGVDGGALARLDLVIAHLRAQGFRVVEGQCLRAEHKDASAPAAERAQELMQFLTDPQVAAVFPPWGGERATELLERLDFDALRALEPKWLLGFSDLSTLQLPLTLCAGWATAHGPNLMDLAPTQSDPLTNSVMSLLSADFSGPVVQRSSTRFQTRWTDFAVRADAPLNLTEPTVWQRLDGSSAALTLQGRLVGGCLDTIAWLAGTRFGDVPAFVRACGEQGTLLYLENAELSPTGLLRALTSLRRHGWFDGLSGLLIGRHAAPAPASALSLTHHEAVRDVLDGLPLPVLIDVDIGHQPPQFTLINGALATVEFRDGAGTLTQVAA